MNILRSFKKIALNIPAVMIILAPVVLSQGQEKSADSAKQIQPQDTAGIFEDTAYRIRMYPIGHEPMQTRPPEPVRNGDFRSFTIVFKRHVEFLLEDPEGRKIGYDASADTTYDDFHGAPYGTWRIGPRDGSSYLEWTDASIYNPFNADYRLTVTQTFEPTYTWWVSCYDYARPPTPNSIDFSKIPVDTGAVHSYTITLGTIPYAPYEVTGGFAGSDNEPADIDRLLSYVSIADNLTELPAGTEAFNLIFVYGGLSFPHTLSATLNSEDVAGLFAPAESLYELVRVPLQPGENRLVLSIQGDAVDGPATDTDSLVFVVE